jgi:hypothetical protein
MSRLQDRLVRLLQDPRVAKLMGNPEVQRLALEVFRLRGRLQGAFEAQVQRAAGVLSLATQRDLRALQRRIRNLERELRDAEERLTAAEGGREARGRS